MLKLKKFNKIFINSFDNLLFSFLLNFSRKKKGKKRDLIGHFVEKLHELRIPDSPLSEVGYVGAFSGFVDLL